MKNNYRTASYLSIINELKTNPPQLFQGERILLLDGLNTFFRAYCSSPVMGSNGQHMGGITGFLLSLGFAIKTIKPTRVVVVFDGEGGSLRRKKLYPEYKAHRTGVINVNRSESIQYSLQDEKDQQKYQIARLVEYLRVLPVSIITADHVEADDIIAYISLMEKESRVYIMSRDKDFYQLLSDNIFVWSPTKKQLYDTDTFFEEYNMLPQNYMLARAIIGDDSADNIKGVPRVGMKSLLKEVPQLLSSDDIFSLEDILKFVEEKLQEKKCKKIFQAIYDNRSVIERNLKLIDLSHLDFSTTTKQQITNQYDRKKINKLDRLMFLKMLGDDGIENAIRTVDVWLREVFHTLNSKRIDKNE